LADVDKARHIAAVEAGLSHERRRGFNQLNMNKLDSPASASPGGAPKQKTSGGSTFIVIAVLVLLSAAVYWLVHQRQAAAPAKGSGRGGAGQLIPVVAGHVEQRDVPVYLDGIGTVEAFNSVTIRAQVNGQLLKLHFVEGQDVKKGDLLAQIDPAPYQATLDQTAAKKQQDEAQLANARLDLKRYADLLVTDGTTQQTYDTEKALVAQLEAMVRADQAAVDSAQVNLNYTAIHSPIDGRVGIRMVDQGNIIQTGDANGIVVITQLRPIHILFTLPETALAKLHPGSGETNFTVLAVSREGTNILATGRLGVINNQIDATTGTIQLRAEFANDNLHLWPGEFVNTRLLLTTRTNSLVVPASVVQRGPDGTYAFVLQPEGTNQTVTMQPVKVSQIDNGVALVEDGLQPGQAVVVDGQYKLQEGSRVNPTWVEMNAAAAAPEDAGGVKKVHPHKKKPQPES
jgi:membrane fusion protein, multidrug efflux system